MCFNRLAPHWPKCLFNHFLKKKYQHFEGKNQNTVKMEFQFVSRSSNKLRKSWATKATHIQFMKEFGIESILFPHRFI